MNLYIEIISVYSSWYNIKVCIQNEKEKKQEVIDIGQRKAYKQVYSKSEISFQSSQHRGFRTAFQ